MLDRATMHAFRNQTWLMIYYIIYSCRATQCGASFVVSESVAPAELPQGIMAAAVQSYAAAALQLLDGDLRQQGSGQRGTSAESCEATHVHGAGSCVICGAVGMACMLHSGGGGFSSKVGQIMLGPSCLWKGHHCMQSFMGLTRVVLQHVLQQVQSSWRRCWQNLCPGLCLCWGECQLIKVWQLPCSRPCEGINGAQHRAQATQLVYVRAAREQWPCACQSIEG